MGYSIFESTMVDLSYPQIEKFAHKRAPVLFPVSVVEEHGPHLCTGVDIYLTQCVCSKIKKCLSENHIESIIAPPFYWGINSMTDGFPGSLTISQNTAKQMLYEILQNFEKWGFSHVFLISFHGDIQHMNMLAELVQEAVSKLKLQIYYVVEGSLFSVLGKEDYANCFLPVNLSVEQCSVESDYMDLHAGANETSWMLSEYPQLVDYDIAKSLKPSELNLSEIKRWMSGGESSKGIIPNGYVGNPANIQIDRIRQVEKNVVDEFSKVIQAALNQ